MLDKSLRLIAKKLREEGRSYVEIAKILDITPRSARNICNYNLKANCKKRGPKFKITSMEKFYIKRQISIILNAGEKVTCKKIRNEVTKPVSKWTLQRCLKSIKYKYRKICQRIVLNQKHKDERVKIVSNWLEQNLQWTSVAFSDEKLFSMDGPDNFLTYAPQKLTIFRNKRQCKGGGLMVYMIVTPNGLISHRIINRTLDAENYIGILSSLTIPHMKLNGNNLMLQQDNSPVHTAKKVKLFLQNAGLYSIKWPARSPDLNIVEDIWKAISDIVYDGYQFNRKPDLEDSINCAINHINLNRRDFIKSLYAKFTQRLIKVLLYKGNIINK